MDSWGRARISLVPSATGIGIKYETGTERGKGARFPWELSNKCVLVKRKRGVESWNVAKETYFQSASMGKALWLFFRGAPNFV